jgi:hypothetical protein
MKSFDEVYEVPHRWTEVASPRPGERCRYSVREVDGQKRYFTEVVMTLPGVTPERVLSLLSGEWSWWHHGAFEIRGRDPNGVVDTTFWPSPTPVVKLLLRLAPPASRANGITRFFGEMHGTSEGAYYFDTVAAAGGTQLTSRQLGVPRGIIPALMGMERFAKTHILGELGEFSFPLPKGSGFVGLRQDLGCP